MKKERTVKPEDITVRVEGDRPVADVRGGEQYVDDRVADAASKKKAEKIWEGGKSILRDIAGQVTSIMEEADKVIPTINLLGSGDGFIEVAHSARRKTVSAVAFKVADEEGLGHLIVEDVSVTLRGSLAAWAIGQLSEHKQSDEFKVTRKQILVDGFEVLRRNYSKSNDHIEVLNQLAKAGLFSSAVEAKVRKA